MRPIESQTLGRTIWAVNSDEGRGQLIFDGVPASDIYSAGELERMRGISKEGLLALQMAKDIFPGATFESVEKIEPKPQVIKSSTTDQMSLL